MFTEITWQDWLAAADPTALTLKAIDRYKASRTFARALEASCYFRGENTAVARKTVLRARKIETRDASGRKRIRSATQDVVGNRIPSGFLFRFVTQQNQYLLSEGVGLPGDIRPRLGADFDQQLELLGEKALLHGTAWGYWNTDHLEVLEAAKNPYSGFLALLDELTGEAMVGIQFWQVSAERPMYVRLFELDGVTLLRRAGDAIDVVQPKRPYLMTVRSDALGESVASQGNYGALPVIPLHANAGHHSELTPAIKAKIDAYDHILSDFADNLDRANDVYWVLNNFAGTTDDVAELLEEINRVKAVANLSDGSGAASTAEPRTIDVPYAARQAALTLLERALYQDYMALDMDALTGGSLTNVAIRAAAANLNLKADRYEWQVRRFVSSLLRLIGCPCEEIRFKRQAIANESETVADIAVMRGDIDHRTALRLNPYIQPEEVEGLLLGDAAPL
ncbi:MAG: phage portal protein [Christensenellaceae bacterium]|nr:phage portal protein [Christensenellaceae bacterium]